MRIIQRNETDGFFPIVRKVVARPQTTMGRESRIIKGRRFFLREKNAKKQAGQLALTSRGRFANNSHLGEGTISATAILTSPPSHLRSSRSSLTSTATVILTSSPPPLLRSRPHISSSSLTIILLTSPPRSLSP